MSAKNFPFRLIAIALTACAAVAVFALRGLPAQSSTVPAAPVPLAAPRGVAASLNDYIDKIDVSWEPVRGAALYRVYRSASADPATMQPIATTLAGGFSDTTAAVGVDYYYSVAAENSAGASARSAIVSGRRASGSFHSTVFSPLGPPQSPAQNQPTAAKAALGKTIFWDEQLSSTLTVACGTCHRPSAGGGDPRRAFSPGPDGALGGADDVAGSPGVPVNAANGNYSFAPLYGFGPQVTPRRAPSYLNAAYSFNGSFWDGRAANDFRDPLTTLVLLADSASLESQSVAPPLSGVEMAHAGRDWNGVVASLTNARPLALARRVPASLARWIDGRSYAQLFEEAFGTPGITPSRIAMAVATHERTLYSDRTPFDRWAQQLENLTDSETRGRDLFVTLDCNFCHGGPLLSNQQFHNVGLRPTGDDAGRGAVTGNGNDNGRFKTPSLRNASLRTSFFHNGRLQTIEEVVDFYNRGGDFAAANKDPRVRPLNMTPQQKADLVAFLKRPLTDPRVAVETAPFDRPKLATESGRLPVVSGTGRAGANGAVPQIAAPEPPVAGNPNFTVIVTNAAPNANAVFFAGAGDPGISPVIPEVNSFFRSSTVTGADGTGQVHLTLNDSWTLYGQTLYGRWYVTDAAAANGFSVSTLVTFTIFPRAVPRVAPPKADFDGDSKSDIAIFRPSSGEWWQQRSLAGEVAAAQFGLATDIVQPADFTGDGRADIAFFRPSTGQWFILRSDDGSFYAFPFGTTGDIPAAADFDADGRADAAVFRPSNATWYVLGSTSGTIFVRQFGAAGDKPMPLDFDGDGRADYGVYRPSNGQWWIFHQDGAINAFQFGAPGDIPAPADFTGDGRPDAAVFRPSTGEWYVLRSEDGSFFSLPFGANGDDPAPADYDGDGKADIAVFRAAAGTWYVLRSSGGVAIVPFGQNGDQAL